MFSPEDTTTKIESEDEDDSLSLLTREQRDRHYVDYKKSLQNEYRKKRGPFIRYIIGFFR